MPDIVVPENPPLEDAELLRHLQAAHATKHKQLSKSITTKKFARTYGNMGQEFWDRAHAYVAGNPADHAGKEYRQIMRYPAAWEYAKLRAAEQEPGGISNYSEDPMVRAHSNFVYMKLRAEMKGAYGSGHGDRPAFEKWTALTQLVIENPVLPDLEQAAAPAI